MSKGYVEIENKHTPKKEKKKTYSKMLLETLEQIGRKKENCKRTFNYLRIVEYTMNIDRIHIIVQLPALD